MIKEFEPITRELSSLLEKYIPILSGLPNDVISLRKNSQNRTIRQITGHLIDSVSNNTHRIIHLQYQESPMVFPDYANLGNNDKWIAIQNYQEENWENLLQLLKYYNIHFVHVIANVNPAKLNNEWTSALQKKVSLNTMVIDYLRHFKLHLSEIDELINKNTNI
jgi:hypothetical protein